MKTSHKTKSEIFRLVKMEFCHSRNQALETALLGLISLCLTILNIICIIITGIAILRLKVNINDCTNAMAYGQDA